MATPLLQVPERMHSIAEAAALSSHSPEYITRLIESGELEAVRPSNPRGGRGQWRIYPASLRRWLKCSSSGRSNGVQEVRRNKRREQAETAAFEAMKGGQA